MLYLWNYSTFLISASTCMCLKTIGWFSPPGAHASTLFTKSAWCCLKTPWVQNFGASLPERAPEMHPQTSFHESPYRSHPICSTYLSKFIKIVLTDSWVSPGASHKQSSSHFCRLWDCRILNINSSSKLSHFPRVSFCTFGQAINISWNG